MKAAYSYASWRAAALELDEVEGNDAWKADAESPHYDHELVRDHLHRMRGHRERFELLALRDLIEESLHRNLGDLNNQALYDYAHVGTKRLIEDYLDEVETTFNWLCDTPLPGYPDRLKLKMVRDAMRVFGRSALVLSGGGALGLFHMGVVKALWSEGLLPEVISGASMGAIVAGGVCARDDEALSQLWDQIDAIHRRAVRIQSPAGAFKSGSLLSPGQLYEHVTSNLGLLTFKEARERSGRVLNIAVSPTRHRQKPRLLCHLTSPDVLINTAAVASCSLPALFPPAELSRRTSKGEITPYVHGERWIDGSIHGDVPMMRLGRLHNVNHYIVSQANPHVQPFTSVRSRRGLLPTAVELATGSARAQSRQVLNLARRRLGHSPWRPALESAHAMVHQNYTGDINIHPPFRVLDWARVMKNPSLPELEAYIHSGERATWPQLEMIRQHTRVGRVMAQCIARLESRMAAEKKTLAQS